MFVFFLKKIIISTLLRYRRLLFLLDTCHAESMLLHLRAPNIVGVGSSRIEEDSFSFRLSRELGVYEVDEMTNILATYLDDQSANSHSLQQMVGVVLKKERSS